MSPDVEKSEKLVGAEFAQHGVRNLRAYSHNVLGILHFNPLSWQNNQVCLLALAPLAKIRHAFIFRSEQVGGYETLHSDAAAQKGH